MTCIVIVYGIFRVSAKDKHHIEFDSSWNSILILPQLLGSFSLFELVFCYALTCLGLPHSLSPTQLLHTGSVGSGSAFPSPFLGMFPISLVFEVILIMLNEFGCCTFL